tara:strand:+ start:39 stop:785 length:747 start_codon:yes stop_codon:yes gene_type:complete
MNESDGFKANCYICKKNYIAQGLLGGMCVCNKCYTPWYAGIEIHLEENKKLKEDNEKLNEKLKDTQKAMYDLTMSFSKQLSDASTTMIKDVKEINQLKEEIDKLKEEIKHKNSKFCEWGEENQKLKEENEKIGKLVISQTDKLKEVSIKYNDGYKINQKLKKEIDEKAGMIFYEDGVNVGTFGLTDADYIKGIEKLKEKIEVLEKSKIIKQRKYIHYKNLVLQHECGDVSEYEEDDYFGFGEKPYSKK